MKKITKLILCLAFGFAIQANAQVKISDTGNTAPAASAVLELESTTRGLLPPRMTQAQRDAINSPATGLMIFQTDEVPGYYLYNGSAWVILVAGNGGVNVVNKTPAADTDITLLKTETFVTVDVNNSDADLITTVTLPTVTSADNGLAITVKNVGSYDEVVEVIGNGGATIDGLTAVSNLYRWKSRTFVATGGNWLKKEKEVEMTNTFDVGPNESWTTIPEILGFLDAHMTAPSVVRLDGGTYTITATQSINLPEALTIQGPSYGQAYIVAGAIPAGDEMFNCVSEVSFKMLAFESGAGTYGDAAGENALNLVTEGQYHEIKDCTFDGFNSAIYVSEDVDMWLFESDISGCENGVEIASNGAVSFFTSESDFSDCTNSINLVSADGATVSVQNCTFTCVGAQTGLLYNRGSVAGKFQNIESMFFTNNTWNNVGTFISGFDFANADGLDANVEIVNNAGIGDKTPHCHINVLNNATVTSIPATPAYTKANWTNTSSYTVNWLLNNNRITYQSNRVKDVVIHISGNLTVNSNNRNISVAIVKGGATGTVYGEITVRTGNSGTYTPFSTVVYLQDVAQNNYFEVFCNSDVGSVNVTLSDLNIYASAE